MISEATSVQMTIGKLEAGVAILLSPDHQLIEVPSSILPKGVQTGAIVNITIERNFDKEKSKQKEFEDLQNEIYCLYSNPPQPPIIITKLITQTSITINWQKLILNNCSLLKLDVFKNGQKIVSNVLDLVNANLRESLDAPQNQIQFDLPGLNSFKIGALDVNKDYEIRVEMKTSAGVYSSNILNVKTHTLDNLTGMNICFGQFGQSNDSDSQIDKLIKLIYKIGASYTEDLTIDNTHLICVQPKGPKYEKAMEWNIPIVSPKFLETCASSGKIQAVGQYYVSNKPE